MKTLMKNHRTAMLCLKYIPMIMFLLMWGYTVFAVFGWHLIIADSIVSCSILPSILIFALSDVFHFCWIHKALTGYSLCVDLFITTNRYISLGAFLIPIKSVFVVAGAILFVLLMFKLYVKNENCNSCVVVEKRCR